MAHGVMFHHFHSNEHAAKPGSIDSDGFSNMLEYLAETFNLLDAQTFLDKARSRSLGEADIVLTFDDALKSQVDVALPVLKEASITGMFNVYSSVFSGEPDPLEIYADFRATTYSDFLSFWSDFQLAAREEFPDLVSQLPSAYPGDYLSNFPFYSLEERQFRFLRDSLLRPKAYRVVMDQMLKSSSYDAAARIPSLWMSKEDLLAIAGAGHEIGLHSHSHPTRMSELPRTEQESEYVQNRDWITSELGVTPTVVAHPCGDYSAETLDVLRNLGVTVGFRSSLTPGVTDSALEIPRQDHALIAKELRDR